MTGVVSTNVPVRMWSGKWPYGSIVVPECVWAKRDSSAGSERGAATESAAEDRPDGHHDDFWTGRGAIQNGRREPGRESQWPGPVDIFREGEAQDDVEVTKIDTEKNIVTFENHGEEQVIPLANGVATGGNVATQKRTKFFTATIRCVWRALQQPSPKTCGNG